MAVTRPAASVTDFGNTAHSTLSVTFGGTVKLALIQVVSFNTQGAWTTATLGGTAMTNLATNIAGSSLIYHTVYYMVNPPTGSAQTVQLNWTNFVSTVISASGYAGVDTTTPFRTQTGGNPYLSTALNPGTALSTALSSSTGDLGVDAAGWNATTDGTMTASQTQNWQILSPTPNALRAGASEKTDGGTMAWNFTVSAAGSQLGMTLAAAAVTSGAVPSRMLLGVGL